MSLDEEMLKKFGGVTTNSLNTFVTDTEDTESYLEKYSKSSYFDREKLVSLFYKSKQSFSVLSINIQSLNAKIAQLRIMLNDLNQNGLYFSVICLQESWLSEDADTTLLNLDGYGGLLIYLRQEYGYKTLPLYTFRYLGGTVSGNSLT